MTEEITKEEIAVLDEILSIPEDKASADIFKSRRFITFIVYLLATFLVLPFLDTAFPEWHINAPQMIEDVTNVVLVLIGGYSAQDAMKAYKGE